MQVVVDGSANIIIRGDSAQLRDVSGAQPEWRTFECTASIPPAADVRFRQIDGRGRVAMREFRDGAAMIHVEDPAGGRDTYAFELTWGGGDFRGGPQPGRGDDRDGWYRQREENFRGDWHQRFFERVREDIDHVQSITFPVGADQFRLARTKQELNDLQRNSATGNFNTRDLNDVINALGRVVADNRLSGRDRDILNDDLNRLRDFRDRRGWR